MEQKNIFCSIDQASTEQMCEMGGKAATLAKLSIKNFPVPAGAALFKKPITQEEWNQVVNWWTDQGSPKVAVRSSASGEDSADFSYAGQFLTLLQISTKAQLCDAILACFQAVAQKSSQAYTSHFKIDDIPMHVLIQHMIQSEFSGVYFSKDPRHEHAGWLVESVAGQGEQLVSAQVTPFRFSEKVDKTQSVGQEIPKNWQSNFLDEVVRWGKKVEEELGYKVDMEWAIDSQGKFWILQARPITTENRTSEDHTIREMARIRSEYAPDTKWNGHTFAEWTGTPTELTFQLWQKAFSGNNAFDKALKAIGYRGIETQEMGLEPTLLNRIFGRAYLNLKSMEPVYFGESPYVVNPVPRPHLEFSFSKLSVALLLRAPIGIYRMIKVAWRVQTSRQEIAKQALAVSGVTEASTLNPFALKAELEKMSLQSLMLKMRNLFDRIAEDEMQGPFLITLLIESTTQGLLALLKKDLGEVKANELSLRMLGEGIQTVASQMHQQYSEIGGSEERWRSFLSKYGHRGVGELELSHPRWIETKLNKLERKTFHRSSGFGPDLSKELEKVSKLRKPVLDQEIQELKHLLQIREEIKMVVMKSYAQLRWVANEIGKKTGLAEMIFWLRIEEIEGFVQRIDSQDIDRLGLLPQSTASAKLLKLATERKAAVTALKAVDLPMSFSLSELGRVIGQQDEMDSSVVHGVTLSPGVSAGRVHIVTDPNLEDLNSWTEDVVLVAEATDPGWTPLFERAKAVIVARGGVLSHCAIVAREMGLPAVGEIQGASHIFQEGERVWVDGNHGTISKSN